MADNQGRPTGPAAQAAAMAARQRHQALMNAAHGREAEQASYGEAPLAERGPKSE